LLAWVPKEKLERSHYKAQALRRYVSPKLACGRSTRDMNEAARSITMCAQHDYSAIGIRGWE
jgi:hypothetical protein